MELMRLASAVSEAPNPPPMLTADHHLVLETIRRPNGTVNVLAPSSELAR